MSLCPSRLGHARHAPASAMPRQTRAATRPPYECTTPCASMVTPTKNCSRREQAGGAKSRAPASHSEQREPDGRAHALEEDVAARTRCTSALRARAARGSSTHLGTSKKAYVKKNALVATASAPSALCASFTRPSAHSLPNSLPVMRRSRSRPKRRALPMAELRKASARRCGHTAASPLTGRGN